MAEVLKAPDLREITDNLISPNHSKEVVFEIKDPDAFDPAKRKVVFCTVIRITRKENKNNGVVLVIEGLWRASYEPYPPCKTSFFRAYYDMRQSHWTFAPSPILNF